jgi:hypothetical protein
MVTEMEYRVILRNLHSAASFPKKEQAIPNRTQLKHYLDKCRGEMWRKRANSLLCALRHDEALISVRGVHLQSTLGSFLTNYCKHDSTDIRMNKAHFSQVRPTH